MHTSMWFKVGNFRTNLQIQKENNLLIQIPQFWAQKKKNLTSWQLHAQGNNK